MLFILYIFNYPSKLQSCGSNQTKGGLYNTIKKEDPQWGGGVLDAGAQKRKEGTAEHNKIWE